MLSKAIVSLLTLAVAVSAVPSQATMLTSVVGQYKVGLEASDRGPGAERQDLGHSIVRLYEYMRKEDMIDEIGPRNGLTSG